MCFRSDPNLAIETNRPISNVPVLSNILKRLVLEKTRSYLVENDLLPRFQSAYRPFHSTKTAITKIHMDILKAANEGRFSLLILLDLSSAFDLVNYNILINKLYSKFGFKGLVLEWYKSYLNNRCYYLTNTSVRTNLFHLHTGVPQGFVIGPLLFNLYSSDQLHKDIT